MYTEDKLKQYIPEAHGSFTNKRQYRHLGLERWLITVFADTAEDPALVPNIYIVSFQF